MGYVFNALLLLGAVLALSGFIVAKRPDAKAVIDKIAPYQALIGVALLALGVIYLLFGGIHALRGFSAQPVYGIAVLGGLVAAISLGILFGTPQVMKWMPGDLTMARRAEELQHKIAPYQALAGLLALGSAVVSLLYMTGLIKLGSAIGMN
jgi:hypothetical protein